jgi:hypothetical protein
MIGISFILRIPIRIIAREKIELLPGQLITATARVIDSKERRVAALFIVNERDHSSDTAFKMGIITWRHQKWTSRSFR